MALMHTKLNTCNWENFDELFQHLLNLVTQQIQMGELPAADPFNSFMLDFSPEQKFEIAKLYSEHYKRKTMLNL